MGRGFGRGAKSVAIVTHAQAGTAGKKTPKGLRRVRQRKRQRFAKKHDAQAQLEQSLGMAEQASNTPLSLSQEIASIQIPHVVNKRQKGFGGLRKHIIQAVKDVRRRHVAKQQRQARAKMAALAAKYEMEKKKKQRGRK